MQKNSVLWWIVGIVVVVIIVIAVAMGHANAPVPPASTSSTTPVAGQAVTATFLCDAGKTIIAEFVPGTTTPSADPSQPPTSTDSVNLTLSDGTTLSLPHAVSADGARYANADESIVFWNVGNTATFTENGTSTYTNCATAPAS